ncbi:hypothetical protein [Ichthyenterobacterium magnum]|uniref:Uncharacterized protein n=1 Tax=Ichthyenterobacterium magnum TaxID=1230530 RepID=A0A420DVY5_9FLAO|nr:hypothetical protein [Ichthyenterobacterium magnum]RKE98375.1 hypothetical protein BXY80_0459 [Ichthyenterobacterium magnum]
MNKKDIFIGFIVGLIANIIGLLLAIYFFGNGQGIESTIKKSIAEGFFTKLISLGALINLVAFFIFIKNKKDYRAGGVLLATILVAVTTFILKLI